MKAKYVFHLNKKYYTMIKDGIKWAEYRPQTYKYRKIPLLIPGDIIRFDLGYCSLSSPNHIYKKVTFVTLTPLYELPKYVKEVYPKNEPHELFHEVKFENL